ARVGGPPQPAAAQGHAPEHLHSPATGTGTTLANLAWVPPTVEEINPHPKATVESVLDAIGSLHVQRDANGHAKRHQPLALLWATGEARRGAQRMTGWPDARERIGSLIQEFGAANKDHAYLPFLALLGTGIWELTDRPPRAQSSARRQWLNSKKP